LHGYNEGSLDEGFPEMGTAYDEKLQRVSGTDDYQGDDDDDDEEDENEEDGEDDDAGIGFGFGWR
jgi:hypothetical protein